MSLSTWLPFAAVCLLGAMSPGPSFLMVIRNTILGSIFHGIATGVSHAIGIGAYALFSITGLVILIEEAPLVFHALSWAGVVYLAWMGWKGITARAGMAAKLSNESTPIGISKSALDGLMISLFNPKIVAFFVALFSQFLDQATNTANSVIMVFTPMLIDGAWYTLIAILVSQRFLIKLLREKAVWLDRIIGLFLIIIAIQFFFEPLAG